MAGYEGHEKRKEEKKHHQAHGEGDAADSGG
jgi:hypothetical protein